MLMIRQQEGSHTFCPGQNPRCRRGITSEPDPLSQKDNKDEVQTDHPVQHICLTHHDVKCEAHRVGW